MNDSKLIKSHLKFNSTCGKVEAKLQKRISFGEVSVDYYPGDGICAEVNAEVVPLRDIPARGKLDEEWWKTHAI